MSEIKTAIKGTLQADGSLLPANKANKGVMVVKTDGTNAGEPYGYVTKENLAQIVREELASILNGDSVNTLAKLVGLDSSANMKSITTANLASVLGGYDMGWRMKIPSAQGIRYFKITPSTASKAYVYHVSGCCSAAGSTIDVELHHGGGVHEGRMLAYNAFSTIFDSSYFQYWYDDNNIMYLMVGSYSSPAITAPISMTVEQITAIPSTATKVTLKHEFSFAGKNAFAEIPISSGIYNISGGSTSVYPAQYGILVVFNSENNDARLLLFLSLLSWESTTSPKLYYSSAKESGESLIMKPWVEL